jgi:hypothetical protein
MAESADLTASVARGAAQLRAAAAFVRKCAWELAAEGHNARPDHVRRRSESLGQEDILQERTFQVEPQILATGRTVQLTQRWRCNRKKRMDAPDDA